MWMHPRMYIYYFNIYFSHIPVKCFMLGEMFCATVR